MRSLSLRLDLRSCSCGGAVNAAALAAAQAKTVAVSLMFSRQPHAHEWSGVQRSIDTMNVDASKILRPWFGVQRCCWAKKMYKESSLPRLELL